MDVHERSEEQSDLWWRRLGATGAVANAHEALEERQQARARIDRALARIDLRGWDPMVDDVASAG